MRIALDRLTVVAHPLPRRARAAGRRRTSLVGVAAVLACLSPFGCNCYDDGEPKAPGCESDGAVRIANEGWAHVDAADELIYDHNPPASGPHFSVWASYAIHEDVVDRGNWVHNLEHGAIVLLVGPDATDAQRQTMLDAFEAIPEDPDCGHRRVILTDDPLLDDAMAAVAADHVLEGDALTIDQIVAFAEACRDRAPEDICL